MESTSRDIIVIGASAGGVEALRTIVGQLPEDLPASIFIVLHIWPGGKSFLPDILRRVCPFKVEHAVDGEPIERGRVYIAPPDQHLFVGHRRVAVIRGPRENRCRPGINPLFRSAATAYGPRVIGVILSGTMDDGSAGLWAIKQSGGLTIVQDPADALFSEMPQSAIDAVEVDHVAPLSTLSGLIHRHTKDLVPVHPAPRIAEVIRLNDDAAKMKPQEMEIDKIGKRSVFSCPECNGALWELVEGGQLSFRCHVGHAYSSKSMREEQKLILEQSLWSALRALAESAEFDQRLAKRATESNLNKAAEAYQRNADEKKEQEARIRAFLTAIPSAPSSTDSAVG